MDMQSIIFIWVCLVGLCMGSFYNVVILRSLSGESIVFPPSKCPKCNHKLYPWHNIPVISYIFLRGKCHFCKEKISIQYPIIELLTMVLFAFAYLKHNLSLTTIFVIIWLSCLLIMSMTDLKEKIVDCNLTILMAICGLIHYYTYAGWQGVLHSFLGLLVGAVVVEIIARLGYIFAKTRAMGEADTYVAGALGAIFGLNGILPVLFYSLLASMVFIIPMFWYKKLKVGDKLTCVLMILFFLVLVIYKALLQNYYVLSVLGLLTAALVYSLIKGMKNSESLSYLPYVPALSAGALYAMIIM